MPLSTRRLKTEALSSLLDLDVPQPALKLRLKGFLEDDHCVILGAGVVKVVDEDITENLLYTFQPDLPLSKQPVYQIQILREQVGLAYDGKILRNVIPQEGVIIYGCAYANACPDHTWEFYDVFPANHPYFSFVFPPAQEKEPGLYLWVLSWRGDLAPEDVLVTMFEVESNT